MEESRQPQSYASSDNQLEPPDRLSLTEKAARLHAQGDVLAAEAAYRTLIALDPENATAHCQLGNVLADLGKRDEALQCYDRAIGLNPLVPDPFDFRGIVLAQLKRLPEALGSLDKALEIDPCNLNAMNNRANVLKALNRLDEALAAQDQVLMALPEFAPGYNNRGNILLSLNRLEEAIASFDRAIALDPRHVEPYCNRAGALVKLVRTEEAIGAYRKALGFDPNQPAAMLELATLLATSHQLEGAAAAFDRAITLDPGNVDAYISLGDVLLMLGRADAAVACLVRASSIAPNKSEIFGRLGVAYVQLDRPDEALACYYRAVGLKASDAPARETPELGRHEAEVSLDRAIQPDQDYPYQLGQCSYIAMRLAIWDLFDDWSGKMKAAVEKGERAVGPFDFLALIDDPKLQRMCASKFVEVELPPLRVIPAAAKYPRRNRIRVGYFSGDFHEHATMRLLIETLEAHDRDRFEWFGFSFGPQTLDGWADRTSRAFDHFIELRGISDVGAADKARELGIDIAVDFKGYTHGGRAPIFTARAAPIQVNYLGYPGTAGHDAIDYLIADDFLVPAGFEQFYSEKIVRLNRSYQANMRLEDIPRSRSRSSENLPQNAFVFCSFNQLYKLTPDMFRSWMDILKAARGSVLWLWANSEFSRNRLREFASSHGVDPERLYFADFVPQQDHLDRLRLADLFLDTAPCNAHTTASDALRMGLPILTCPGRAFAARVAGSLLHAIGLPELIVPDLDSYVRSAVALASDVDLFAETKAKLSHATRSSSLFDPEDMARSLEAAFLQMYERYQGDLQPEHIRL